MKIVLLGDTGGNIDEGMKNITHCLAKTLSKNNDLLVLNPKHALTRTFWLHLRGFNPDVVHYIPGPSLKSFTVMKIISIYLGGTRTKYVMSAPLPQLSNIVKPIIKFLKPDLMLVQSKKYELFFKEIGLNVAFVPLSGVDMSKFQPVTLKEKKEIRRKFGIPEGAYVILHVGHINRGRNIQILKNVELSSTDKIVIVGSTSTVFEQKLLEELKEAGYYIIQDYIENINEVFNMSDCYIFPTSTANHAVEIPLSVLEAMSCNLPVITTEYGGLKDIFQEGGGLFFVKHESEYAQSLKIVKDGRFILRNREQVLLYSWQAITIKTESLYRSLLG